MPVFEIKTARQFLEKLHEEQADLSVRTSCLRVTRSTRRSPPTISMSGCGPILRNRDAPPSGQIKRHSRLISRARGANSD